MGEENFLQSSLTKEQQETQLINQLNAKNNECQILLKTVEKACLDSREPHKCLAFGEYDADGNFLPPAELPNIHVLQKALEGIYDRLQRAKEVEGTHKDLQIDASINIALTALHLVKSTPGAIAQLIYTGAGMKLPEITEYVAKPLEPGVCPECAGECQVPVDVSLPGAPQHEEFVRCFTCQGSGRVPIKPEDQCTKPD